MFVSMKEKIVCSDGKKYKHWFTSFCKLSILFSLKFVNTKFTIFNGSIYFYSNVKGFFLYYTKYVHVICTRLLINVSYSLLFVFVQF